MTVPPISVPQVLVIVLYCASHRPPAVPRRHQPITVNRDGHTVSLVASAGLERIREGEVSAAVLLVGAKLSTALILAAALATALSAHAQQAAVKAAPPAKPADDSKIEKIEIKAGKIDASNTKGGMTFATLRAATKIKLDAAKAWSNGQAISGTALYASNGDLDIYARAGGISMTTFSGKTASKVKAEAMIALASGAGVAA